MKQTSDLNGNPLEKSKRYLIVDPLCESDNGTEVTFDGINLLDSEGLDYNEFMTPYTMYGHPNELHGVLPT